MSKRCRIHITICKHSITRNIFIYSMPIYCYSILAYFSQYSICILIKFLSINKGHSVIIISITDININLPIIC